MYIHEARRGIAEAETGQRSNYKREIGRLNPDHEQATLFSPERWDIRRFAEGDHLPVNVGELIDKRTFGVQNGIRVLDMPVFMPGQGWGIPPELVQFDETIAMAVKYEREVNPDLDNYYVYITVDQKPAAPGKSQRRPGWHTDAYITDETGMQVDVIAENRGAIEHQNGLLVDRTYVIYDDSGLPTRFLPGPFPLDCDPQDCDAVLQTFDELAEGKEPVTYPPFTLLRLDPYDVHASTPNDTDEEITRTFVKISFSKHIYNRDMNTQNPLFDYNWTLVPRDTQKREHRNILLGYDNPERENYKAINPRVLLGNDEIEVDWAKAEPFYARKVEGVRAVPAVAGERLSTIVNNSLVTVNVAQEGSWKVTTSQGDSYFLTEKQFRENYEEKSDDTGIYPSKRVVKKMIQLTQDVRFIAPWGAIQYIPTGGVIVISNEHDIYGIHPDNFSASYELCDVEDSR